jgi:phage terminase Nu1 subunit (DNA packaging protein)
MYIDTRSAAAIYDISASTLAKWRLRGCGPPYLKRGRWLRYDTDKFDAWLLKHERANTSQQPPAASPPTR